MSKIRVTKKFRFEMAHALWKYDGLCKNIHGHSYELYVTLIGKPIDDPNSPKNGMVIDFSDLKRIVKEPIVDYFDHSLVVNNQGDLKQENVLSQSSDKFIELPFQPTCEKLVEHFATIIIKRLPKNVKLHSLRLFETITSYAEWFASDNE
jgi:6-pyruvoyltetrahydropterin/6-carboxytetrahydropterin synthase